MNVSEYRYTLTRRLPGPCEPLVFCMLNPSTADETADDPTIRRCIGFARREHACGIVVVNLYAMRATDPKLLMDARDPVGEHNDKILRRIASGVHDPRETFPPLATARIICAWGANGAARHRAQYVTTMFRDAGAKLLCLGKTAQGAPRHPLYVRGDQPLIAYGE